LLRPEPSASRRLEQRLVAFGAAGPGRCAISTSGFPLARGFFSGDVRWSRLVGVVVENVDVAQDGIASAEAEFVAALLAATDPGVPENDALDALRE
jgi:hypothetical protein